MSVESRLLTYVRDDVYSQIHHVGDDAFFLGGNLGMLNELVDVLFGNPILHDDVQKNNPKFVVSRYLRRHL